MGIEILALEQEIKKLKLEMTEILHAISHDFGAPIRQIACFTEMLLANNKLLSTLDEKSMRHINNIQKANNNIQSLLASLFEYSDLVKSELTMETVCLNTAIQDIVKSDFDNIIQKNKATISISILPQIIANEKYILLLFFHLIKNALTYHTKESAPAVIISYTETPAEWTFCIADNGIGIAPHRHNIVFQIFKRDVREDEYEGTGIGLSIASKIVKKHGGNIYLESNTGQGTKVYFTIPKK